jgi:hypothetical protein
MKLATPGWRRLSIQVAPFCCSIPRIYGGHFADPVFISIPRDMEKNNYERERTMPRKGIEIF